SRSPSSPRSCGRRSTPPALRGGSGKRRRGTCRTASRAPLERTGFRPDVVAPLARRSTRHGHCSALTRDYCTRGAAVPEEERDEECERADGPKFVQEAREGREVRELPVGPAEEAQQLVDRAVGAEDLRDEGAREEREDREIEAPRAREPAQRREERHPAGEPGEARGGDPLLREVGLQHDGS